MTSIRHAGAMEIPERAAPEYSSVQEGGGAEVMALGGGG